MTFAILGRRLVVRLDSAAEAASRVLVEWLLSVITLVLGVCKVRISSRLVT